MVGCVWWIHRERAVGSKNMQERRREERPMSGLRAQGRIRCSFQDTESAGDGGGPSLEGQSGGSISRESSLRRPRK